MQGRAGSGTGCIRSLAAAGLVAVSAGVGCVEHEHPAASHDDGSPSAFSFSFAWLHHLNVLVDAAGHIYAIPGQEDHSLAAERTLLGKVDPKRLEETLLTLPRIRGGFAKTPGLDGWCVDIRVSFSDGSRTRMILWNIVTPEIIEALRLLEPHAGERFRWETRYIHEALEHGHKLGNALLVLAHPSPAEAKGSDEYDCFPIEWE